MKRSIKDLLPRNAVNLDKVVESLDFSFDNLDNSESYKFLVNKSYHLSAKTLNTLFFVNDSFKHENE